MKQIIAITWKEIRDNIRDKRSLGMGLLYPIFWPIFMAVTFIAAISVSSINFEKETELHVAGQQFAPNLVAHLKQNNLNAVDAPENITDDVLNARVPVVLEIPDNYGDRLREGLPAPLKVYLNESDTDSTKAARKLTSVLRGYSNSINQRRLMVRGIDVNLFDSIDIDEEDVSAEGKGGQVQGLMMPFLCIFSMIMGAFYLAIEVTAGEREKHSLEPLLSLPVSRNKLALGKYFALVLFCMLSLVIILVSFGVTFNVIPRDKIGSLFNLGIGQLVQSALILLPLTFFIAAVLMMISSFTKSSKEAQTYLGLLTILPIVPYMIMSFKTIPTKTEILATPLLSQFKLMDKLFKDETIEPMHYLLSGGTTLLAALIFLGIAMWLYKQDRILQ